MLVGGIVIATKEVDPLAVGETSYGVPQGDVFTTFFEGYAAERQARRDDITVTGIVTDHEGKEVKRESASPAQEQPFPPGDGRGSDTPWRSCWRISRLPSTS
jgi:hypothetical protein